jgi:transketolase
MEVKAIRDGIGDGLVELGKKDDRVVVLTADVKESVRVERFAQMFPERFVECGVAEQNMMGIAAGLAAAGKVPFVAAYAVFSPGRSWDQLRVAVCYSNLPVKIIGAHAGLSVGPDGATHQALEDIAITRVLPNLTVWVPADYDEAKKMTVESVQIPGPVYIRSVREKSPNDPTSLARRASLGAGQVAIIGAGPILYECIIAAEELEKEGIGVMVVNGGKIKPMDKEMIVETAVDCGAIVTAEDHQIYGGLGSAVAEVVAQYYPVPMEFVGVDDSFGESGTPEELAEKYGLKAANIVEAAKKVIGRKTLLPNFR